VRNGAKCLKAAERLEALSGDIRRVTCVPGLELLMLWSFAPFDDRDGVSRERLCSGRRAGEPITGRISPGAGMLEASGSRLA
jgi:hypothetical protein